jgi:hypothetical protein
MRPRTITALLTALLASLGQACSDAQIARGQNVPQPPSGPVVASTRQHAFMIPYRIEPARNPQEQPVEVQLNVSSDQGATWEVADRVKPDKENFVFRAPHDGEYWYAIRTVDAQGVTRPIGHLQAQLKVVVDTVAPRLELTAQRGVAGEIVVRWQAVDPYLKPTSLELEYQAAPGEPWEHVAIEAPPSAMRHTSSGEATWWPKARGGSVTVRAKITDSAGNPAVSQAVVNMDPEPTGAGAHLTSGAPTATDGGRSLDSKRWPADRATTNPLGHGADFDKRADRDPPSRPSDWRGSIGGSAVPPNSPRRAPQPVPTRPVARTVRDPVKPSPLDFGILPIGQRPRMVASRTFELQYELDSVGASGVGRVELWGTLDGGRSWTVYGVDSDNRSPLPVRVENEGIYGFRIVAQSGSGLSGPKPVSGDEADVWIGVDLANPVGRITAIEVSDEGAELVVTWEVGDDALDVTPVSLEFSESRRGPWTPIAAGLENSGSYTWQIEKRVPPVIYVRMQVGDEAGNVEIFNWDQPVSIDRSRPQGRIRDVRPIGR